MINKFRFKKSDKLVVNNFSVCDNNNTNRTECALKENVFSRVLGEDMKQKINELFMQAQFSPDQDLASDGLRRALGESLDQNRLQVECIDGALKCLETTLLRIHAHLDHGERGDTCNTRNCVPHQKMVISLVEQSICTQCGASSEPLSYTQMMHYIPTSRLLYQVKTNIGNQTSSSFSQNLRKVGSMVDIRTCQNACNAVIQISQTLMNRPEVVSLGLAWNSERPTVEKIVEVLYSIGTTLALADIFNTISDKQNIEMYKHNLVAMITFNGQQYITFFFHVNLKIWIYFDDSTVTEVGPSWEQVIETCKRIHYQPLFLIYALADGSYREEQNQNDIYFKNKVNTVLKRSVTPVPEKSISGKVTPRPYSEYQNLHVIQKNLYSQHEPVKNEPEYVTKKALEGYQTPTPQVNNHPMLPNGSPSKIKGNFLADMNNPRRRDSGNWSGDRNSASSGSSTTMESPYLYMPGNGTRIIGSPIKNKGELGDPGYDSYSLSSNDSSSMGTLHLLKMGNLAKIPEDYNNVSVQNQSLNCEVLCNEADDLLIKSRQLEDEYDLILALALCNAATTKARAALNAPYNNPQTLTLARMKHNTCIMRARSLHRRITQTRIPLVKETPEIRHTREGSSGSGRHSRQSSRDKGSHSRQNSKEFVVEKPKSQVTNIEIYATLPKKKDGLKKLIAKNSQHEEYNDIQVIKNNSLTKREKPREVREKRSKSEDRSKMPKDLIVASESTYGFKNSKQEKEEEKDKDKDGKGKKQHKIRRKLLMGGLIKRKNRSMPDLMELAVNDSSSKPKIKPIDDSRVSKTSGQETTCGYLSEGHLDFSINNANPRLEKSKLMRKNSTYLDSTCKNLIISKVPPPPPLRTTSTLSNNGGRPICPLPDEVIYRNTEDMKFNNPSNRNSYQNGYDKDINFGYNTIVTRADIHQEQINSHTKDEGVDEVDCLPRHVHLEDLPPYPSPVGSIIHSRQASGDLPPPPTLSDLTALEQELNKTIKRANSDILEIPNKLQPILASGLPPQVVNSTGETWLKELKAKQNLRIKKTQFEENNNENNNISNTPPGLPDNKESTQSVRDIASKFENIKIAKTENEPSTKVTVKKREDFAVSIPNEQIAEELREVELLNATVKKTLNKDDNEEIRKHRQKKSVSFCDQVILVATADEKEDDSYINNPILERVLRSAMNKPETAAIKQEIILLRENENKLYGCTENQICENSVSEESLYIRKNSLDNLISRPNPSGPTNDEHSYGKYNPPLLQNQCSTPNMDYTHQVQNGLQNGQNFHNYDPNYQQNNDLQIKENALVHNYPQRPNYQYNDSYNLQQKHTLYGTKQTNDQPMVVQRQSPLLNFNTPYRQSPNQTNLQNVQQNVQEYKQFYHSSLTKPSPCNLPYRPESSQENYSVSPSVYPQQPNNQQFHQVCYRNYGSNRHCPSPALSKSSSNSGKYQYKNEMVPPNQRVEPQMMYNQKPQEYDYNSPYQRMPVQYNTKPETYQQVAYPENKFYPSQEKNSPYQHVLQVRQGVKKPLDSGSKNIHEYNMPKNSVAPIIPNNVNNTVYSNQITNNVNNINNNVNTNGYNNQTMCSLCRKKPVVSISLYCQDCEFYVSPTPKALVTPIVVNNANNSVSTDKTKCNLCRKKPVLSLNLYCQDCEFYMSRFKPKR